MTLAHWVAPVIAAVWLVPLQSLAQASARARGWRSFYPFVGRASWTAHTAAADDTPQPGISLSRVHKSLSKKHIRNQGTSVTHTAAPVAADTSLHHCAGLTCLLATCPHITSVVRHCRETFAGSWRRSASASLPPRPRPRCSFNHKSAATPPGRCLQRQEQEASAEAGQHITAGARASPGDSCMRTTLVCAQAEAAGKLANVLAPLLHSLNGASLTLYTRNLRRHAHAYAGVQARALVFTRSEAVAKVVPDDGVEEPHTILATNHLKPQLCQHPGPDAPCLVAATALRRRRRDGSRRRRRWAGSGHTHAKTQGQLPTPLPLLPVSLPTRAATRSSRGVRFEGRG